MEHRSMPALEQWMSSKALDVSAGMISWVKVYLSNGRMGGRVPATVGGGGGVGRQGKCGADSHVLGLQPFVAVAPGQHCDVRPGVHIQESSIL